MKHERINDFTVPPPTSFKKKVIFSVVVRYGGLRCEDIYQHTSHQIYGHFGNYGQIKKRQKC